MTRRERDALIVLSDEKLLRFCTLEWRSGTGPGGQKRNKSKVYLRLTHNDSGTMVSCGEFRTRTDNQRRAIRRMRIALALTLRAPTQQKTSTELRHYLTVRPKTSNIRAESSLIGLAHFIDCLVSSKAELEQTDTLQGCSETKRSFSPYIIYKKMVMSSAIVDIGVTAASIRKHVDKNSELAKRVRALLST